MPWMISEEDDQFCVYKEDADGVPMGPSLGCHDTRSDAEAQLEALYASEPQASAFTFGMTAHVLVASISDDDAMIPWACDTIMMLGRPTSDRRVVTSIASFRDFPLPLMDQTVTADAHDGAKLVGRVDGAEVHGDGRVSAWGVIDASFPEGAAAVRRIETGQQRGCSVDMGACRFSADGEWNGTVDGSDLYMYDVEIMGLTLTPFPAFAESRTFEIVHTDASDEGKDEVPELVADGAPVAPPLDWFLDPELEGRTRLTVTEDGRVFGHLAPWGECHIGIQGQCVRAPRSAANYGWFALGTMRCDEGCEVPIGTITMDTGHADKSLRARAAAAHYDNTGTVVADIAVGEDAYGIWVAGAMRTEATPEQYRALRAARLSGDWRTINGNLELVAVLAVNVGGFPVYEEAVAADGSLQTVIASLDDEDAELHHEADALYERVHSALVDALAARVHVS